MNSEIYVISAIITDGSAICTASDTLTPEDFSDKKYALVFSAALELYNSGSPIDIITISERLKNTGNLSKVGGASWLSQTSNSFTGSSNLEYHCRLVKQDSIYRRLTLAGKQIAAIDPSIGAFEALDTAEKMIFEIWCGTGNRAAQSIALSASKAMASTLEAAKKPGGITGVRTGMLKTDMITGGWQPSDLIILAARPGMGKTSLALKYAYGAAQSQTPVLIFSMEMSADQLAGRMICMAESIDSTRAQQGRLTPSDLERYKAGCERLSRLPIYINDSPGLTIGQVRSEARKLQMRHGIGIVIVDYLQLMGGTKGANREQEISEISRGLKHLAKELNVPVIALSQLSRAVETRGGSKRPQLSDLRESGAIEQDADIVQFIYRPEYYHIMTDEEGNSTKGMAELITAKNRKGALEVLEVQFDAEFTNFYEHEKKEFSSHYEKAPF